MPVRADIAAEGSTNDAAQSETQQWLTKVAISFPLLNESRVTNMMHYANGHGGEKSDDMTEHGTPHAYRACRQPCHEESPPTDRAHSNHRLRLQET